MCDRNARAKHRELHKRRYAHQPGASPFGSGRRFPFRVTGPRHTAAPPVAVYGVRASRGGTGNQWGREPTTHIGML